MQNKCICIALLSLLIFDVAASFKDFQFRYDSPTFSNYGTIGLINAPTARFYEEGTLAFNWSHNQPYLRGSILAYPFSWFEASYQYTDINNYLYSPYKEFSGGQSFKDKSFDSKFLILKEGRYAPQIALGFRDFAGTGIFSGEYLVASKKIGAFDFSIGAGWGTLSGGKKFKNPLVDLDERFKTREIDGSEGGEFSFNSFFSGDIGLFGGVEYSIPFSRGMKLKLELDPVDYNIEGLKLVKSQSRVNFGLVYPISKNLFTRFGMTKGNNLNFSFQYKLHNKERNGYRKKNDPIKLVEYPEIVKNVISEDSTNFRAYRGAMAYLGDRGIRLQTANAVDSKFEITMLQTRYWEHVRAVGRTYKVLDQILPEKFTHISISHLNANLDSATIEIPRESFRRYESQKMTTVLFNDTKFSNQSGIRDTHEFQPPAKFPYIYNSFEPFIRSQIGGPDGFYFGEIGLSFKSEVVLGEGFTFDAELAQGIYDNFADLKLASNSILPHVRSDIVQYLKSTQGKMHINSFQLNYFNDIKTDLYFKLSAGIFEQMFGGYGFELLYRPFKSIWGIGMEVFDVKQREFDMLFDFQDYRTVTGHFNFYIREPRSQVLIYLSGGRYLAKDSGFTLDLSRRFKNGANIGAFFSLTDISTEEFGEGSFDKGIYFNIPLQVFGPKFRRGQTSFSLKPLTRDGAARMGHSKKLWGLTSSSRYQRLISDWELFYE